MDHRVPRVGTYLRVEVHLVAADTDGALVVHCCYPPWSLRKRFEILRRRWNCEVGCLAHAGFHEAFMAACMFRNHWDCRSILRVPSVCWWPSWGMAMAWTCSALSTTSLSAQMRMPPRSNTSSQISPQGPLPEAMLFLALRFSSRVPATTTPATHSRRVACCREHTGL